MAHYTLAQQAAMNADIATARDHVDRAIAADPDFATALMLRGTFGTPAEQQRFGTRALAAAKQLPVDEQAFVRAMSTADASAQAAGLAPLAAKYPQDTWLGLAYAYSLMTAGDPSAAKAALQQVLAVDPRHPGALNSLGYAAVALGDFDLAEASFGKYVEAHPEEANAYDSMGEMLMLAGRYDESAKYYRQALDRNPEMASAKAKLAQIEITKQLRSYEKAAMASDAKAVARLYSKDTKAFPHDSAPLLGRDAFEARLREDYGQRKGKYTVAFETDDFMLVDDGTAIEIGTITESIDGEPRAGHYTSVWAEIDGEWLIVRDMWTNYAPAPEATASNR